MTPYDLPLPDTDPPPPAHPARRAAVIVTPGTMTYLLSIPFLVMQTLPPERHRWLVTLCAEEPGKIRAFGGFDVPVSVGLEALDDADTVLMPHWMDPAVIPSPKLISALQKAADTGKEVAGLCVGAYPLAYAGLLDGHRAVADGRLHFLRAGGLAPAGGEGQAQRQCAGQNRVLFHGDSSCVFI